MRPVLLVIVMHGQASLLVAIISLARRTVRKPDKPARHLSACDRDLVCSLLCFIEWMCKNNAGSDDSDLPTSIILARRVQQASVRYLTLYNYRISIASASWPVSHLSAWSRPAWP